jgi:hypothetical protein
MMQPGPRWRSTHPQHIDNIEPPPGTGLKIPRMGLRGIIKNGCYKSQDIMLRPLCHSEGLPGTF